MARTPVRKARSDLRISAKARNRRQKSTASRKLGVPEKIVKTVKTISLHMVRKARSKKIRKRTGIELIVEGWLIACGANFVAEKAISRTHVDFYLPDSKTVVEVCGCYWHAHECKKGPKGFTAKQARKRAKDGKRYAFLQNAGNRLLVLWECEIEKSPDTAREKVLEHVG